MMKREILRMCRVATIAISIITISVAWFAENRYVRGAFDVVALCLLLLHDWMQGNAIREIVKAATRNLGADPMADGSIPEEITPVMREWGKIGDQPIVRYEEVNPALAHALYIGGVPVEKGTGMCWTQIPWEKDGNNCPYEWFVNEAKYGAKYRKRVNSDAENRSPG